MTHSFPTRRSSDLGEVGQRRLVDQPQDIRGCMPGSGLEVARGFAFKEPGFEIPGDVRPAGAERLDDQWQVGQFTAAVRARVHRDDLIGERGPAARRSEARRVGQSGCQYVEITVVAVSLKKN